MAARSPTASLDAAHSRVCVSRGPGNPARSAQLGWGVRYAQSEQARAIRAQPGRHPAPCTRPQDGRCFRLPRLYSRSPRSRRPPVPPWGPARAPARPRSRPRTATATRPPRRRTASSTPSAPAAGCEPLRRDARPRPGRAPALGGHGAPRLLRPRQPRRRDAQRPRARRRLRRARRRLARRREPRLGHRRARDARTRSSTRGSRARRTAATCSRAPTASSASASPSGAPSKRPACPGATYTLNVGVDPANASACNGADDRIRSVGRPLRRHVHGRAAAARPRPPARD